MNALKRYAQSRASISEDELYAQVFEPAFCQVAEQYRRTQRFSVATTCEACEGALARHIGEPVEKLRDGIRLSVGRGPERGELYGASVRPNAPSLSNDRVTGEDTFRRALSAPIDSAFQAARKFAQSVDLHECVEPTVEMPIGYRVSALPMAETASPERQRAWWLLAGVCGQLEPEAALPVPLDGTFLSWLADPDDASSCAFWAMLSTLRQSRSTFSSAHAADDAMSTEGQA